jgi:hypothetical protein
VSHPMIRYHDADDAQESLGQSSVSFLSASLKLFFDEMRVELRRFNRDANCAKKRGSLLRIRSGSLQLELTSRNPEQISAVLKETTPHRPRPSTSLSVTAPSTMTRLFEKADTGLRP